MAVRFLDESTQSVRWEDLQIGMGTKCVKIGLHLFNVPVQASPLGELVLDTKAGKILFSLAKLVPVTDVSSVR